ncbi:MAG: hypothetical protein U0797_31765 [Gemmataceae bacterium]
MLIRFELELRRLGMMLRALLVGVLAALAGCDRKAAWRGVGTDGDEPRPMAGQASGGDAGDAATR